MTEQLNKKIVELESFILKGDKKNSKVSEKGTYWHIDHSLQILSEISKILKDSDPNDFKPKFSLSKLIIMNSGYIPRGKGRAPKQTLPQKEKSKEELLLQLENVKIKVASLDTLEKNKTFRHPLFGWLDLKDTIKFMGIHTQHHIKIMRDIVK